MDKTSHAFCAEQVKDLDPDRYRMTVLEPPSCRAAMWSVIAFNTEIAKTREVVTETQIGHMRLQWWRDRLEEVYSENNGAWQKNEILSGLSQAVKSHNLDIEDFNALTYAREFDLENVPPADMDGLIKYADLTTTPLNRLIIRIEGTQIDAKALTDISTGYALIGLVRAIPHHAQQGRIYLPSELLQRHGVSHADILRNVKPDKLQEIVSDICKTALSFLTYPQLPSKFLDMSQKTALSYQKRIKKCHFDVFDLRLRHAGIALPLTLWWHYN